MEGRLVLLNKIGTLVLYLQFPPPHPEPSVLVADFFHTSRREKASLMPYELRIHIFRIAGRLFLKNLFPISQIFHITSPSFRRMFANSNPLWRPLRPIEYRRTGCRARGRGIRASSCCRATEPLGPRPRSSYRVVLLEQVHNEPGRLRLSTGASGVCSPASCAEDLAGVERGVAVRAPPLLRGGSGFSPGVPLPEEDRKFKKGDNGKE